MFDKRYQVDRTFFTVKNFPNHVEAASRIRYLLFMHACMDGYLAHNNNNTFRIPYLRFGNKVSNEDYSA